jgi:hypothetical protein
MLPGSQAMPGVEQAGSPAWDFEHVVQPSDHSKHEGLALP